MIVFTLALIAGSTQLSTMAGFLASGEAGLRVSLGMALIALIMVAIAENSRIPVGAFGYNVLGIPVAMGVLYPFIGLLLSPLIAAAAMAFSSVTVVTNANRLRLFEPTRIYS
jgi:hypothetical protein